MKSINSIDVIKKLQQDCDTLNNHKLFIRSLLNEDIDIKQVRYDETKNALIICVEPWVWAWTVKEKLNNKLSELREYFGVDLKKVVVRFLFT